MVSRGHSDVVDSTTSACVSACTCVRARVCVSAGLLRGSAGRCARPGHWRPDCPAKTGWTAGWPAGYTGKAPAGRRGGGGGREGWEEDAARHSSRRHWATERYCPGTPPWRGPLHTGLHSGLLAAAGGLASHSPTRRTQDEILGAPRSPRSPASSQRELREARSCEAD